MHQYLSIPSSNELCYEYYQHTYLQTFCILSETPACLNLNNVGIKRDRIEECHESSMILSSRSYLNIGHFDVSEVFNIYAKDHQSIDIIFIDFYMLCYTDNPLYGK
jgi:hypothetical protein